jgi:hypothetical protein
LPECFDARLIDARKGRATRDGTAPSGGFAGWLAFLPMS